MGRTPRPPLNGGGVTEPPVGEGLPPPPSGNLGIFVGGDLSVCTAKFVCKVRRLLSQFRYRKDANLRDYQLNTSGWFYTSRPRNSSNSTIHTVARFRHCCIQLPMKRWCQLNRAPVAHDACPALSSYQNKCSN